MVQVRSMRVRMGHRCMPVPMPVRCHGRIAWGMVMLVVLVVRMDVIMFQCVVSMLMRMALRQVQPQPYRHTGSRDDEGPRGMIPERNCRERSYEWCDGEVSPRASTAKVP